MTDHTRTDPARAALDQLLRTRINAATAGERPAGQHTLTGDHHIESADASRRDYGTHVNPQLTRLLSAFDLDRVYVRGQGTELTDATGRTCLDFAGAYGALPFGHSPEVIWTALDRARRDAIPGFVQPSVLGPAGTLAARLVRLAPGDLDRVTFVNSGAEAVEAAIKIARSHTGRTGILSTDEGFHGKTLGALSATGRAAYQEAFGAPAPGFARIPFGNLPALRTALRSGDFAAFIVEPIQGEGGVRVPSADYLREVRRLCDEFGVLMILDEVQTGLGRTGTMFAYEQSGIVPDVLTVAKSLSGGMVPIGAVLSRSRHTGETFSLRHTSTFAGGALGARVGLAVLDELEHGSTLDNVRNRGEQLLSGLHALAARWPQVVTTVRGRGLLIGLEVTGDLNVIGRQGLIASLAESESLAMVMCSHLLNQGVRIAPTLFGARVLRIEPPLTVTAHECDRFLAAIERTVASIAAGDSAALLGHLVGRPAQPVRPVQPTPARPPRHTPVAGEVRFGFVAHPVDLAGFADFDPGIAHWKDAEREALLKRFDRAASILNPAPFVIGSGSVTSAMGARVHGELIGVPYTAEQLMALPAQRAVEMVRQAVDLAVERGAQLVGLGAYTSIVTRNGTDLDGVSVPLTTGNSFTAAAAVRSVLRAADARKLDATTATVAVIGAGGAIGRAVCNALAPRVGRLILVGRPGRVSQRLDRTVATVLAAAAGVPESPASGDLARAVRAGRTRAELAAAGLLVLTDDARTAVGGARLVITASSSPGTLVEPGDFAPDSIVCDVAQPANVPASVLRERPDVALFDGGIVTLPRDTDFGLRYGLPPGLTYACMAETMLLALQEQLREPEPTLFSRGEELDPRTVLRIGELAERHGFGLAEARTWRLTDAGAGQ